MNQEDKKILRAIEKRPGMHGPDMMFWCPGCQCGHAVWTSEVNSLQARWTFNGNWEKPTFTPSLKITYETWEPPVTPENMDAFRKNPWEQTKKVQICHTVVTDGVINFCPDCTHELAGKAVPMEPF